MNKSQLLLLKSYELVAILIFKYPYKGIRIPPGIQVTPDKGRNPVPGNQDQLRGIQNARLSSISFTRS